MIDYVYTWSPGQHRQCSDLLQAEWFRDHFQAVARFSVPIQTGPEAHPAPCTVDTRSFLAVKQLTTHPILALSLWMDWSSTSPSPLCLHRHVLYWHLPICIYKVQFKSGLQHPAWPPHHLCYHPAVFFHHFVWWYFYSCSEKLFKRCFYFNFFNRISWGVCVLNCINFDNLIIFSPPWFCQYPRPCSIVGKMFDERWVGRGLKGSSCDHIEILSWHFL